MDEGKGSSLKGAATITLMGLNLVFWVVPLILVAVLKLLVPIDAWRQWTSRVLTRLAEGWIATNSRIFRVMRSMPMVVAGARGSRSAAVVPGRVESPILGRHPGAAVDVQPPHTLSEVLPEAAS